ncbi:NifU family protein [Bombella saccharophila]|uniref:NifU family protein n=1 Tax=Bombella saccharophila TaxID=2967338 RepID=A0ABT3W867_9PROT|nr:NifU family protein [Bombella saccharophila]MCX5615267.1 NifU family protein [Bombella saccharophila]
MMIETEDTPNPATLKFLPGRDVTGTRPSVDFAEAGLVAGRSALADALFGMGDVKRVFLGRDFVSVTKEDAADWSALRPRILVTLTDFFKEGEPALTGEIAAPEADISPEDAEIVAQVKELLDTRVRPAVASDGGDIVFRGYREGVVYLSMQGACSGCPSSRATLRHGVENMLRHYVPEVTAVEPVEE